MGFDDNFQWKHQHINFFVVVVVVICFGKWVYKLFVKQHKNCTRKKNQIERVNCIMTGRIMHAL